MGELPGGWAWARLGDLGAWTGGGTPSKANAVFWTEGEIPWVSPKDMKAERVGEAAERITLAAVRSSAAKMVPAGSILCVVRSGILKHTFPVAIAECDLTLNQDMRALTPTAGVDADYVRLFLTLNNDAILHGCAKDGTTVASINPDQLAAISIPLAPVAEQARIAKEAKRLLTELDEAKAALARARAGLAEYRASLLHAACTGQLTAAWRASRPHPAEDGPALLRRILAERRAAWERAEVARLHVRSKPSPVGEGWKARYPEPAVPDIMALLALPDSWTWATVDQLGMVSGGITKNNSRTSADLAIPYLRVANVGENDLRLKDVSVIGVKRSELDRLILHAGDILFVEGNGSPDHIGRVAVWDGSISPCVHQNHLIKCRPVLPMLSALLLAWFMSPAGRERVRAVAASTSGLYTLSISKISAFSIPLPSAAELDAIESLLAENIVEGQQAESRLDRVSESLTDLRQSVLHAAFTGRLVPQDPADEPAAALLARLRDAPAAPRRARAKTPAKASV